jgi:hypothetical protein
VGDRGARCERLLCSEDKKISRRNFVLCPCPDPKEGPGWFIFLVVAWTLCPKSISDRFGQEHLATTKRRANNLKKKKVEVTYCVCTDASEIEQKITNQLDRAETNSVIVIG